MRVGVLVCSIQTRSEINLDLTEMYGPKNNCIFKQFYKSNFDLFLGMFARISAISPADTNRLKSC